MALPAAVPASKLFLFADYMIIVIRADNDNYCGDHHDHDDNENQMLDNQICFQSSPNLFLPSMHHHHDPHHNLTLKVYKQLLLSMIITIVMIDDNHDIHREHLLLRVYMELLLSLGYTMIFAVIRSC